MSTSLLIWSGPCLPGMKPTWSLSIYITIKLDSLEARIFFHNFEIIVDQGNLAIVANITHIFPRFGGDRDIGRIKIPAEGDSKN